MPVHLLVNQPENHCLVSDKSLVVAFDVRDGLLLVTAVGQLPENGCRMPVLILLLLEGLDPVIGDTHSHPVIEADTAILELDGKSGHTAHLLGNGDSVGIDSMYQEVGESEIGYRVGVLASVVVVAIAAERFSKPVVIIEHGGHAVETETIELEFLKPVFTVGEQEMQHLVLSVIETEGIPRGMFPTVVGIEIEAACTVKSPETLILILDGMGMDDIHDYGDSQLMGAVNEALQLLGGAEA